jgi:hypothetical protein
VCSSDLATLFKISERYFKGLLALLRWGYRRYASKPFLKYLKDILRGCLLCFAGSNKGAACFASLGVPKVCKEEKAELQLYFKEVF